MQRCRRSGAPGERYNYTPPPPPYKREQKGWSIIARHGQVLRNVTARTTSSTGVCVSLRAFAFRTFLSNYVITHVPPFRISLPRGLCNLSFLPTTYVLSLVDRSPAITRPRIEFHANDYKVPAICGCVRPRRGAPLLRYHPSRRNA